MTSKVPVDLQEAYEEVMSLFLNKVPVTEMNFGKVVAGDLMGYGTTKEEFIRNIREYQRFIQVQEDQSKGLIMNFKREPIHEYLSEDENSAINVEEITISIDTEDSVNQFTVRLSIVLEKIGGHWKMVHFHGSVPVETAEEDTWHLKEWEKEKEKLEKLVAEQTDDLLLKNRELEIETALERVRARTMAMQRSEEMADAAFVLFEQLRALGGNLWATGFGLCEQNKDEDVFWFANENGVLPRISIPNTVDPAHLQMYQGWEDDKKLLSIEGSGQALKEHYEYFMTLPEVRPIFQKILDDGLTFPDWQQWNAAYFSHGYLLIITLEPYPEPDILKRFAKVFEQTYTRFLDLQKAEEQAREARIEAALEKVRSRSLAMMSSDELGDVITVIFDELTEFDIPVEDGVALITFNKNSKDLTEWMANSGFGSAMNFQLPYFEHPVLSNLWQAKERGDQTFFHRYSKQESLTFHKHIFEHSDFMHTPEEVKEHCLNAETYATTIAFQNNTAIFINDYSGNTLTEADIDLLRRFSSVFEQTYTRFLDLQKAEEQNRQAQINLALERVRARSLAMQKPDDLNTVNEELLRQLQELHIDGLSGVSIWLIDKEGLITAWDLSNPGNMRDPRSANLRYDATKFDLIGEPWRIFNSSDMDYVVLEYPVEKLRKAVKEWAEVDTSIADDFQEALDNGSLTHQWNPLARHSHGFLSIDLVKPPSDGIREIVTKMAGVFSLAYRRFLDLQKAEEQAREAEIQLALERVRAKSLAMHKSEELGDLSLELVKQVQNLGLETWFCAFNIHDDHPDGSLEWGSNGEAVFPKYRTPKEGIFLEYLEAGQRGEKLYIREIPESECEAHYEYLCSLPGVGEQLLEMKANGIPFPSSQIDHVAFFKYGYVLFITFEPAPEAHDTFKRFAHVFEQSYTRFLDLQKAEKQAREAQIEAALERVRSRSMGMQKSDELIGVVREIGKGIHELGIQLHYSQIYTDYSYDPKTGINIWVDVEGRDYLEKFQLPYIDHSITFNYYNALNEGLDYFSDRFSKAEKDSYFKLLFKYSDLKRIPSKRKELILNASGWTRFTVILDEAALNFGRYNLDEFTDEEHEIFIRFAKVFGQAYTRFLDLQRVEAQAREAKIETALEKIRSRTMAMQKGEELQEVAVLLYKELIALGVTNFVTCGYVDINEEIQRQHTWVTAPGGDTMGLFHLPLQGDATFDERYAAWKQQQPIFHQSIAGQVRSDHLEYAITTFNSKEAEEMVRSQFPDPTVFYCFNFPHGYLHTVGGTRLKEEEELLLVRFTKVFAQTYTRFLDLQKAEAQAREGQIETALEKVRSRTMGMQSSEELPEVANMLFQEVQELGIPAWSCGYCILEEDRRSSICIMSSEGTLQTPFLLPHTGEASFVEWDEFVHSEETFFTQELGGEALQSHYDYMKSLPQLTPIFNDLVEAGLTLPTYQINHLCKFPHGFLLFITYEKVPDSHDIFRRFTSVFDQTYTRFLDLQKSEVRAREAEVELSLERVRSQVSAMQESADLQDIVVTMRNEFTSLGHDAHYFWYMRWLPDQYKKAMTSGDGSKIGMVMTLPRHIHGDIKKVADWEQSDEPTLVLDMDTEQAVDYVDKMISLGDFEQLDPQAPTLDDIRHIGGLTFIMARTSQGEIGYSLPGVVPDPPEEAIQTLIRFAGVFDFAYQRFEDLKEAEKQARLIREERDRLEDALAELHATQDQLIQQEKLASLGQLTAGIAHEIKNPLNFVNNFSEVSVELVEETKEELLAISDRLSAEDKEKVEEALEILLGIEMNLKKIHEHGSRADSIVKSMLEHSRGGSGKLELTHLNSVVEEFVNLSFHGMRAGKEPIDVDITYELNEETGEVPLIAEDFSRVIVNLCNNAFDAMRQKVSTDKSYKPLLTIRTISEKDKVTIEIEDNGPGIPEDIKDKIMQPFFTTKKGTEGTGLGLSITNDIIQAHGGVLELHSTPSENTIFKIKLAV